MSNHQLAIRHSCSLTRFSSPPYRYHFLPWLFGAYKNKVVTPAPTIVNLHQSSPAPPAPKTPEDRAKAAQAYAKAKQTLNQNQLNAQKVLRYEEFFLRLLFFVPSTPIATAWQELPPQILDSSPIRTRMRALSATGTAMPLLALKND